MTSITDIPRNSVQAARRLATTVRDALDDQRRASRRRALPTLESPYGDLLDALERDGACITDLETLRLPSTTALLAAADQIVADVKEKAAPTDKGRKNYSLSASADQIESLPDLVSWGLEPALLSLVEHYLGTPVAYRGLMFRRDIADGQKVETRLWHRDGEDRRIVKAIVYLNDVTLDHGPFEYVPKSKTPAGAPRLTDGRILDEDMVRFAPERDWVACTGKRGSVVLCDPCTIYHRGRVPKADRFTLFFAYNSREPRHPEHCAPLFARDRFMATQKLSPIQRAALDYDYQS